MTSKSTAARELYIELLQKVVINEIYKDPPILAARYLRRAIRKGIVPGGFDDKQRQLGRDWPSIAHSMIGRKRLDNLRYCVNDVLTRKIPGDMIETGVWRGGACILMRGMLKAWCDETRTVWVADSFAGLPPPDAESYPADAGDTHHKVEVLAVSLETVQANFSLYGLLDERVRFLKGWFKDTLPDAPIERLSVIRLDGDMYESTMDGFRALYHKLSPGGYLIVDDYHAVKGCRAAVHDFISTLEPREKVEIQEIDGTGVFWQRKLD
ncbi:TylF/MycF family methyltransferase [Tabrizicola sp.]|uniref:TylF/MycF family methyltransferase n=1 Tax=Tabrizicola sp. TaxID=2005166 RepID=UPI003F3D6FBA